MWNDHELRDRLGKAAYRYATENFSDEAAGTALGRILDSVEDEKGTDKATNTTGWAVPVVWQRSTVPGKPSTSESQSFGQSSFRVLDIYFLNLRLSI